MTTRLDDLLGKTHGGIGFAIIRAAVAVGVNFRIVEFGEVFAEVVVRGKAVCNR